MRSKSIAAKSVSKPAISQQPTDSSVVLSDVAATTHDAAVERRDVTLFVKAEPTKWSALIVKNGIKPE